MGTVLVTGATGFVGSAVVKKLLKTGAPVRITVRQSSSRKNIENLNVEEVEADIRDRQSVKKALQGVTHLYHVAGLYRTWMRDYDMLHSVNVEGTRSVLDAAQEAGVRKVVHTSSIAALGIRDDGEKSDEHTAFNLHHARLPYEQSKYESEQVAFEYGRRGLPVVVVRPALVMGENDIYPTPSGKLVLDVLRRRIPSYFEGGIDVVDVDDVAEGHIHAMQHGTPGESYNLGCRDNFTTMKDLIDRIAVAGRVRPPGLKVPVAMALLWAGLLTLVADCITHREPVATPSNIRALSLKKRVDFSKAVRELSLPQTPLDEVIEKTVKFYQQEGYVLK